MQGKSLTAEEMSYGGVGSRNEGTEPPKERPKNSMQRRWALRETIGTNVTIARSITVLMR